ncbi:hypothetical protein MPTK1_6g20140 [Marchantia polymorpha subsp. ruderalis]|uniref:FHA domain-containing protein n=2 Tax=Marchantia polymorpha TaxID=3197 RepID=A0AAF6BU24_MARPO|nr:hypothetical protein MARPO_0045s0050 [Marchantia polymorpha]BBN15508.1 hypothetical protein Mp_6g20140 [Marchantia polymorpha subsp. ruderalis]|eukprot:PTQ39381.1 hypothetical protein MARPO_0045s0050 [Marchantia polymorpha]
MTDSEAESNEVVAVVECSSALTANGDDSEAAAVVSPPRPALHLPGTLNLLRPRMSPDQVPGFKVPRFSSKNPPPARKPEPAISTKPPSNDEAIFELDRLAALINPPEPQGAASASAALRILKPKRKDVIWPPPPKGIQESQSEAKLKEGPASSETGVDDGIATEVKLDAVEFVNRDRDDGSQENPIPSGPAIVSEVTGTNLTNKPGVEADIRGEGNSSATDHIIVDRVDGSSEHGMAAGIPVTGQAGAEGGTASESKSAGDRASSGGPQYAKPSWGAPPGHPFSLEVLKEGISLGIVDVSEKAAYMFGRSDRCDFVLEHPTVSRYHAVLQYNAKGQAFIFDMASTHGTFINKRQVKGQAYEKLNVGDIVRFGYSTRLHHFQGPTEFMPEEGLSKAERRAVRLLEAAQERAEREQSILRAKRNASSADGATWGMQEDAEEEEEEEDTEEITWQTFKGELTEKQQKTLEKVHKRNEKLANLKKENDAIQAKEISQGGLTQGQQTQIARNEQRMTQLVEELENMEETLNESIREAISGRSGTKRGGKKSLQNEDEDEDLSDDEFYDRASKLNARKKKEASQVVETAETLLDKKSSLSKEIESVRLLMKAEEEQDKQNGAKMEIESDDPLDQFMTNISTAIVQDRTARLQKELNSLTKESERVVRLLKIADPAGEALRKWEVKQSPESVTATADLAHKIDKRIFPRKDEAKDLASSIDREKDGEKDREAQGGTSDTKEDGSSEKTLDLRPLDPPIRLGAPVTQEKSEDKAVEFHHRETDGTAEFIPYKGRKKDRTESSTNKTTSEKAGNGAALAAEKREEEANGVDADVASSVELLLKHKRGLSEGGTDELTQIATESSQNPKKRKKKTYGPSKPSYMTIAEEEEIWVPPAGQTGDGRTALNEKYGY